MIIHKGKMRKIDCKLKVKSLADADGRMYSIETEKDNLLVSPNHKVHAGIEENNLQPLLVDPVMMIKVLEDNGIAFDSENKNKAADLDSFEMAHVMPEVLKMLNSRNVGVYNLLNLLSDSNCKSPVLSSEFVKNLLQTRRNIKWKTHFRPSNLSNFSKVIRECGPFSIFFNFLTYSSFNSNSSIGYQPILSQNSWSSLDKVPVLMNSSNILFLFNSSLFTSDQFTQEKCFMSDLSCLSNVNVRLAIYTTPLFTNCSNFFNCSTLLLSPALATSTQFTWGSLSNFSFNSSGIDNVILSIFIVPSDYFDTSNSVSIFKSFGSEEKGSEFSPILIIEVYEFVGEGRKLVFMDKEGNEVEVKSTINGNCKCSWRGHVNPQEIWQSRESKPKR